MGESGHAGGACLCGALRFDAAFRANGWRTATARCAGARTAPRS
jgi:hypothetical protein